MGAHTFHSNHHHENLSREQTQKVLLKELCADTNLTTTKWMLTRDVSIRADGSIFLRWGHPLFLFCKRMNNEGPSIYEGRTTFKLLYPRSPLVNIWN